MSLGCLHVMAQHLLACSAATRLVLHSKFWQHEKMLFWFWVPRDCRPAFTSTVGIQNTVFVYFMRHQPGHPLRAQCHNTVVLSCRIHVVSFPSKSRPKHGATCNRLLAGPVSHTRSRFSIGLAYLLVIRLVKLLTVCAVVMHDITRQILA